MQQIIVEDQDGRAVAAPMEVWLGCLLTWMPPDWREEVVDKVRDYMDNLPRIIPGK